VLSPLSFQAVCSVRPGSRWCLMTWGRFRSLAVVQLQLLVDGQGAVLKRLVRRANVVTVIARSGRALRRRRMPIGTSHRPVYNQYRPICMCIWRGRCTSRIPTHDSAMLTRRLSCAHFRARWASLAARSARFCCKWICTISATLWHVSHQYPL